MFDQESLLKGGYQVYWLVAWNVFGPVAGLRLIQITSVT